MCYTKLFIKNLLELTNNKNREVLNILESGLAASMPFKSIKKFVRHDKIITKRSVDLSSYDNVYIIAFGKAADSMTSAVNSIVKIKRGIIIIPRYSKSIIQNKKFQIFNSGHPLPNKISINAAKAVIKFLYERKKNEFVIFLISGGGSSLLALPDKISLNDKIKTTNILLKCGASIHEINCIRKHISKIKGGKLIKNMSCDGASLIMSDVVNNDLSTISSSYTYDDNSTYKNALDIVYKYNLQHKIPNSVLCRLCDGMYERINKIKKTIENQIILSNSDCLMSMANKAKQFGYYVKIVNCLSGNIDRVASKLVKLINNKNNYCIVFGGEPTVKVLDNGVGGRNQELVLRIIKKIETSGIIVASIGTDGIDGNTRYAGAIMKTGSIRTNEIEKYLKKSNSHLFFKKYDGLINTGTTHTNLMDIGVIIKI